jgi:parallel beta-helix repeat protein
MPKFKVSFILILPTLQRLIKNPLTAGRLVVSLLLLGAFWGQGAAMAATYYVATSGSDSSSGTISQPFRTIAKGISVLVAGDTLYIRSGSYSESINSGSQTIPVGTSWSDAPLISAYPSETVTLRSIGLYASYIHYVIFQNLIIDPQNSSSINEAVYLHLVNHIRFIGCEIRNAYQQGVLMPHQGDDFNEFINCHIHHNGHVGNQEHGIYVASSNNLIDSCVIHDNAGYGIHNWDGYAGETTNNNVFRNNRIYANGTAFPSAYSAGIIVSNGTGTLVYNNLLYGNMRGIQIYSNASGTKVYNNTIYNNTYQGILISGSNAIVKNNISYLNGASPIENGGSGTIMSNNLTTDPKFVNVGAMDFHLQSTSPGIDAGATLSEVTTDLDGISRPKGSGYDAGALEYSQTSQAPPPSNLRISSAQ